MTDTASGAIVGSVASSVIISASEELQRQAAIASVTWASNQHWANVATISSAISVIANAMPTRQQVKSVFIHECPPESLIQDLREEVKILRSKLRAETARANKAESEWEKIRIAKERVERALEIMALVYEDELTRKDFWPRGNRELG